MSAKTGNGHWVLSLALLLGALGDVLFRNAGWGINVSIWMAAVFGAVALLRGEGEYPRLSAYIWVAVALSMLAMFRDSMYLRTITLLALLAAVSFATVPVSRAERLQQTVYTFLVRVGETVTVAARVLTHFLPSTLPKDRADLPIPSPGLVRILRSAALSGAALMFFGSLLVSADALFERVVVDLFDFDLATVLSHSAMILLFAWLGCWLLLVLTSGPVPMRTGDPADWRTPGYAMEINSMLATINALFVLFLIVQAGYFFGGQALVLDETGPTYAEYARRGFFEIAAVAACAFLTVLLCDSFVPASKVASRRFFNTMTVSHVLLVGALVASAFHRLMLYIDAYGLTEMRFYVGVAIGWIPLAFLLLAYAVVRSNRAALPRMLVNTLFAAVFVLHAVNPAAIVARTNLTRANAQERFDIEYALSMGADAAPALAEGLPLLSSMQQSEIRSELRKRWDDFEPEIRDWNFSRLEAARATDRL